MKRIMIIMVLMLILPIFAYGEEAAVTTSQDRSISLNKDMVLESAFPSTFALIKEEPDTRGTDVRNIYTLTVDFQGEQYRTDSTYTLLMTVDGVALEIFPNQSLPFSVKRNFKGLTAGRHRIGFQVEGQADTILSSVGKDITVER